MTTPVNHNNDKDKLDAEIKNPLDWCLDQKRFSLKVALGILISALALAMAIYHLFCAGFGQPEAQIHRTVHVAFVLALIYLLFPLRGTWQSRPWWSLIADMICVLLVIVIETYILYDLEAFYTRFGNLTQTDIIVGTVTTFLILEATRRTIGLPMVLVACFFIFHALFADHFFGALYGPPTTWEMLIDTIFMSHNGIYGIPVMVVAAYIVLFIIFGAILLRSGAGNFFSDIAFALVGDKTGGPAKAAVVASAMMGTTSGSAASNVMITGSFTIPLMKRMGYDPVFATSVEAAASTGGQIMPPIMGAVAFIMAEFMGISYLKVCAAAAIPACLYFLSLFGMIHFEAKKKGLVGLPKSELPLFMKVIKDGWPLLIPLIVIVGVLVEGRSVQFAAFWGIVCVFGLSFLYKRTRMSARDFICALILGARASLVVGVGCACAGIIIGTLFTTGLGFRFSSLIIELTMGKVWLALIITMLASLILGMGMTTSAVYITLAALVIPALIKLGVVPIAAHLFCLYFGVISAITPPVALGAFAAAGVGGTNPMKTAIKSAQLGVIAYLAPFMFVYGPELVLVGTSLLRIVIVCITASIGILCLASAMVGYWLEKSTVIERLMLGLAALTMIKPGLLTDVVGLGLLALVLLFQKKRILKLKR